MQTYDNLYVIFPAAGTGRRMGNDQNKLLMPLVGKTIIERTLASFAAFANEQKDSSHPIKLWGVIVTSPLMKKDIEPLLSNAAYAYVNAIVDGGETRSLSVQNGVAALKNLPHPPGDDDIIFIHDAARCLIDGKTLFRCYEGAKKHGVCAAALPVKDTIKAIRGPNDHRVNVTLDRSLLYRIQTPQAFLYKHVRRIYLDNNEQLLDVTDDTALAEHAGIDVVLVEGHEHNIKITTPNDLIVATMLLEKGR